MCQSGVDDVKVYSDGDLNDHFGKVKKVLDALNAADLRLDIDKCAFGVKEIKYLGFIIEAGNGVKADPEKFKAISQWEGPKNVSGVRSFLAFANFYCEFIPNFSDVCGPLNNLTKKGSVWNCSHHQKSSFSRLKQLLASSPVLMKFNPEADTILDADSSGYAIGGVVSQTGEKGRLRPIGFFSRKLSPAESNYEIYDQDLLAIISNIRHFRGESRSPDILSRKSELQPIDSNDERLKKREFQLLKERWISPASKNIILDHPYLAAMVTRSQTQVLKTQIQIPSFNNYQQTEPLIKF